MAEDVLDSLGDDQDTRQEAAHQLIYDVLIEPTKHIHMPNSLEERIRFENQQIHALDLERPTVRQCRRVATFWYRWVESQGMSTREVSRASGRKFGN